MKIRSSTYELRPRRKLGVRAELRPRTGSLLRFEFADSSVGYADCHPWPELGDAPLQKQLGDLLEGRFTPLTFNALELAREDAKARAEGRSLFEGLEIPESHRLLTGLDSGAIDEVARAVDQGFRRVKIKLGTDWLSHLERLRRILETSREIKLRVDFNETLEPASFLEFVSRLDAPGRFDFVEDPVPWSDAMGFSLAASGGVPLALDREASRDVPEALLPEVLVLKPALQDWRKHGARAAGLGRRVVFTSYLDHPLGQLGAAFAAARFQALAAPEICGLLSHSAYEPTEFSEALAVRGPSFYPDSSPGLGLGTLLENLEWRLLGELPE